MFEFVHNNLFLHSLRCARRTSDCNRSGIFGNEVRWRTLSFKHCSAFIFCCFMFLYVSVVLSQELWGLCYLGWQFQGQGEASQIQWPTGRLYTSGQLSTQTIFIIQEIYIPLVPFILFLSRLWASIPPTHNISNKTIQTVQKTGSNFFLVWKYARKFLWWSSYGVYIIQHAFLAQIASLRTVFSSSSASPSYFRIIMPVSVDEAKVLLLNEKSF